MAGTLPAGDEYDIALRGADVVALEEEELVDAVVLEGRDLDDGADGAGEALLDDEVLLALDLSGRGARRDESMKLVHEPALPYTRSSRAAPGCLTYYRQEIQQILTRLIPDLFRVEASGRSHDGLSMCRGSQGVT